MKAAELRLHEKEKQNKVETDKCAYELLAVIDSVSKHKEYMESKLHEMGKELSETTDYLHMVFKWKFSPKSCSFPRSPLRQMPDNRGRLDIIHRWSLFFVSVVVWLLFIVRAVQELDTPSLIAHPISWSLSNGVRIPDSAKGPGFEPTQDKCCLPSGVPYESPNAYEKSLVHKIFGGSLRSQVKCMQCSYCSNKFDPFLDLSLEIVKADSLHKALGHFTAVEQLDGGEKQYMCQQCKQKASDLFEEEIW
ncbi:hypothetical protein V2J09_011685 [Rumex salicifolius]